MTSVLWGFGANHNGQLGTVGPSDSNPTPQSIPLPVKKSIKKISCGKSFALCLPENSSSVLISGLSQSHSKLHKGPNFENLLLPRGLQEAGPILDVCVGGNYATLISSGGELFSYGQLDKGDGEPIGDDSTAIVKPVEILLQHHIINVCIGGYHALALTSSGLCFSWGRNDWGQLGLGNFGQFVQQPQEIKSLIGVPVKQVIAGGEHCFVLSVSGALFAFGNNSSGQLGLGDYNSREYPAHVKLLRSQLVTYVAAGDLHSVALTIDGGVFTFGSGKYGQLGHGSFMNEYTPRKVMELMGSTVIQVACGNNHTLALVKGDSPRLHAFGQGIFGQLGLAKDSYSNANIPILSKHAVDVTSQSVKYRVDSIFAGGDSSFLLNVPSSSKSTIPDLTSLILPTIEHLTSESVTKLLGADSRTLENKLRCIFRNPACLNASFLKSGRNHFYACSGNSGVSMEDAKKAWYSLLTSSRTCRSPDKVGQTISVADFVLNCLSEKLIPSLTSSPPHIEALRLYLTLPANARFENPEYLAMYQCPFAAAVNALEGPAGRVLSKWWGKMDREDFSRLVNSCKRCSVYIMQQLSDSKSEQLLNPLAALQSRHSYSAESQKDVNRLRVLLDMLIILNRINEEERRNDNRLDCEQFYIPEIRDYVKVNESYVAWWHTKQRGQADSIFNLCNYLFIFDAPAKSILLQTDAQLQMHFAAESARRQIIFNNFFTQFSEPEYPFLILTVCRENIVDNAIQQLSQVSKHEDYRKPLKVFFVGEEGDDAGGVRKEFFLLIFKEVFDPKYGMFKLDEQSRLNWFNDILDDPESIKMYHFIGLLCGLAIYNSTIVDISFPLALFKKLLRKPCSLEDLKELSPVVGHSMEQLLDFDGSVEETFSLSFDVTRTLFDTKLTVELVPGGSKKPVTEENREEYVTAYVDYVFNKSVEKQFSAFMHGFGLVCSGTVLTLFHPSELQALVIGNENYDWDAFEQNAEYKGEYHPKHPTILLFWEVFRELSLEDKKKFLLFFTGSDRIPILGMKTIKIIFQPMKVSEDFLPVAHTCFGLLDLPMYSTKETLKNKLLTSIQHTQGFGIA